MLAAFNPGRFANLTRLRAAVHLVLGLAVAGLLVLVSLTSDTTPPKVEVPADDPDFGNDFTLFRRLGTRVRSAENYYDAAFTEMRAHGFPTGSVFNFRIPTFAWVLGALPDDRWARALLGMLGFGALGLLGFAECRERGWQAGVLAVILAFGTVRWCLDPDGPYSPELWASMLIALSLALYGLGRTNLAAALGILALLFRELALPYCVLACLLSLRRRRWQEALVWLAGLASFGIFLGWHAHEVHQHMTADDLQRSDWLCLGGLKFVLVTARMNDYIYSAPGWVVALYLGFGLVGLIGRSGDRGLLAAATVLAYVAAFSIVGNPYNCYWGLIYAPILALGVARSPFVLGNLIRTIGTRTDSSLAPRLA
jgi:hypothetical protein